MNEEKKVSVTVQDMDKLNEEIFKQREKIEAMEAEVSKENKVLSELQMKAVAYMKELGRENYKSPMGSISILERWSWTVPKGEENKAAFMNYLKEKGVYDAMITVNHQTMNSFCREEFEAAAKEGNIGFKIPGLGDPTLFEGLRVQRAKGE